MDSGSSRQDSTTLQSMFAAQRDVYEAKEEINKLDAELQSSTKWLLEHAFTSTSTLYKSKLAQKTDLIQKKAKADEEISAKQNQLDRLIEQFCRRIDGLSGPGSRTIDARLPKQNPLMEEKLNKIIEQSKGLLEKNEALISENKQWKDRILVLEERLRNSAPAAESRTMQDTFGAKQILEINNFIEQQVRALSAEKITRLVDEQGATCIDTFLKSERVKAQISHAAREAAVHTARSELETLFQVQKSSVREELEAEIRNKLETDLRPQLENEIREKINVQLGVNTLSGVVNKFASQVIQQVSSEIYSKVPKEFIEQVGPQFCEDVAPQIRQKLEPEIRTAMLSEIDTKAVPQIRENLASELRQQLQHEIREEVAAQVRERSASRLRKKASSEIVEKVSTEFEIREAVERASPSIKNIDLESRRAYFDQLKSELVKEIEEDKEGGLQIAIESVIRKYTPNMASDLLPELYSKIRPSLEDDVKTFLGSESQSWMKEVADRFIEAAKSARRQEDQKAEILGGLDSFKTECLNYFKERISLLLEEKVRNQQVHGSRQMSESETELLHLLKEAVGSTDTEMKQLQKLVHELLELIMGTNDKPGLHKEHESLTSRVESSIEVWTSKFGAIEALVRMHGSRMNNITSEEVYDGILNVLRREYPIMDQNMVLDLIGGLRQELDSCRTKVEEARVNLLDVTNSSLSTMNAKISKMEHSGVQVATLLVELHTLIQNLAKSNDKIDWKKIFRQIDSIFDGPLGELGKLLTYVFPKPGVLEGG
jgi:hypothetical protein